MDFLFQEGFECWKQHILFKRELLEVLAQNILVHGLFLRFQVLLVQQAPELPVPWVPLVHFPELGSVFQKVNDLLPAIVNFYFTGLGCWL